MESNNPPLPGIKKPESFLELLRFSADSYKSPTMEAVATKNPVIASFKTGLEAELKKSGITKYPTIPVAMEPKYPPIKPAMLLFGLARTIPALFLPRRTPKSHAQESHAKTITNNIARICNE